MAKTLNTNVAVAGVWYRAGDRVGDQIPADVAEKIVNPKVWSYDEADKQPDKQPKSTTGAQLVARVAVGGQWYGPGDEVPDDVARRITNPKVWEGGKAPTFDDKDTDQAADKVSAAAETKPAGDDEDEQHDEAASDDADADRRPARRRRG